MYISLDIGGTEIKSALITPEGIISEEKISKHPSKSRESADKILKNFEDILDFEWQRATEQYAEISGVSVAFPGPFDYDNGISYIKGINKYDSIYGINIRDYLHKSNYSKNRSAEIKFKNDAEMFCLGEYYFGAGKGYERVMYICIGTGLGSGFIERGRLVTDGERVPENGWIYNTIYKDGIADFYLSATGLKNMILQSPYIDSNLSVKELSDEAKQGNLYALEIFKDFGLILSDIILPFVNRFNADCLVIGGQVAKSHDLFCDDIKEKLAAANVELLISHDSAKSAIMAAPLLFREG